MEPIVLRTLAISGSSATSRGSHRETKDMSIAVGLAWAESERRKAAAEIERLRLTEAERFVLREVRDIYADEDDVKCNEIAAVLDGLLGRTK
jgi:hypothetical protein